MIWTVPQIITVSARLSDTLAKVAAPIVVSRQGLGCPPTLPVQFTVFHVKSPEHRWSGAVNREAAMTRQKINWLTVLLSAVVALSSVPPGLRADRSAPAPAGPPSWLPVTVAPDEASRRVDVTIGGQPFTSYIWPERLKKPVIYPLRSATGTLVTRGWPLDPRPG